MSGPACSRMACRCASTQGAMEWAHAWQTHGPAIDKTGFIYMLAGDTGASNTDPYAKAKTADNHWISDRLARDDRRCRCQGDGGLPEDSRCRSDEAVRDVAGIAGPDPDDPGEIGSRIPRRSHSPTRSPAIIYGP